MKVLVDDVYFKKFAVSLQRAIARYGELDEETLVERQKRQVERLVELETEFRYALIQHSFGPSVYKKFIKLICEEKKNILAARPYFRERQTVFTKEIAKALKLQDHASLYKFHFNYQFILFVMKAKNWPENGKLAQLLKEISLLRTELVELNMPLAIARSKMFYMATPKAHLTYMDLIQIASIGLISAIDKFVLPYSKAFRHVAIGRILGDSIESYSLDEDTIVYPYNQKPKRIKDFKCGDEILAVNEKGLPIKTRVVDLHDHGILKAYRVEFEDGYSVVSSADHKFLTKNGMISLKEIVQSNLEVYCESASESRRLDSGLRSKISVQTQSGNSQENVFRMSKCGNLKKIGVGFKRQRKIQSKGRLEFSLRPGMQTKKRSVFDPISRRRLFYKDNQEANSKIERRLEGMAYSDAPLASTGNLVLRNIVRVSYVGERRMYDLEVSHPKHNFLLPNGIVTSNSQTLVHFYPSDKRKLYRANKLVKHQTNVSMDYEKIATGVNEWDSSTDIHTDAAEIADLMAAASCVSTDTPTTVNATGDEVDPTIERYGAAQGTQPDIQFEEIEAIQVIANAITKLTLFEQKLIRLKGIEL